MKERQILFSAPMIRSLLAGTKTQTRRFYCDSVMPEGLKSYQQEELKLIDGIVHGRKAGATEFKMMVGGKGPRGEGNPERCPYGAVGDRLWVREAWRAPKSWDDNPPRSINDMERLSYIADETEIPAGYGRYRHARFMPRWASRITLEITEARVQRLQEISEADAKAEGIERGWYNDQGETPGRYLYFTTGLTRDGYGHATAAEAYREVWEEINGPGSQEENPWCWCLTFKRVELVNG